MSYSANAIDQHNPEQSPFLPDNFYPRLLAHYQSQNAYAQTMAQPAFERRPGHNVHGQTWPNHQKTAPQGGQYPNASTGGAFNNSVAAPAQHAMCGRNETVFNNTPWTAGLPTTPHIMRRESRDGTNSHLMYGDGNLNGQNMMGKEVAYNFGGLPDWQLSATDELQQRVNNFGGSETGTLPSSSPPSFFSTPPDHGPAFRNGELTDERSRSEMRRHFVPVRQEDVKESEPPLQSRLPAVGFDRGQVQQLDMRNQGIMPSFNQNQVLWLADFSGQASLPYYSSSQVPSLSYRQNTTDNASSSYSAADSDLTYLSQRSDAQRDGSTQDQYHTGKTAEDQAQRKEDDRILMEGKAQGLTYKQIRANLKNPVAESTLRGRYRSLVKPRNQRVRKPIWKEKDVELLKAAVVEELKRLENDGRALDAGQRVQKVPWKKIADFISDRGGSYRFGNATCKKKWAEISGSARGR